jgi:hypothetical protein
MKKIQTHGGGGDAHPLVRQPADEVWVIRRIGRERAAIGKVAADVVALDCNVGDLAAIDVVKEVRKSKSSLGSSTGRGLEQIKKRDEKQPDHDPQGEILAEIVHVKGLSHAERGIARRQQYPRRGRPATIFARFRDK